MPLKEKAQTLVFLEEKGIFESYQPILMKRRTFIQKTALGVTGLGLTSTFASASGIINPFAADKINVALIGCRSMGFGILNHAISFE